MRPHGPWKVHSTREVHKDPWVHITQDEVTRPDGSPGRFTVVRITAGVSVLPVAADGTVYLTREFRYAVGRECLETVSGGREPGEEPLAAARRELREEVGIEAADWVDLGSVDPFTSMVLSPAHLFLARGLRFGEADREGTETLRQVKMPLAEAVDAVMAGRVTHAQSCVLILKADRWLRAEAAGSGR